MKAAIVIRPEAEDDVLAAFLHYESERSGLGIEFLEAVRMMVQRIAEAPESYQRKFRTIRRA